MGNTESGQFSDIEWLADLNSLGYQLIMMLVENMKW
jgi:hypothetical protein